VLAPVFDRKALQTAKVIAKVCPLGLGPLPVGCI